MAEDCVFCKIVKGEIPSAKIYEDESFLAFLDIMPANKGHTLIIPKQHFTVLEEMPAGLLQDFILAVQKVSATVFGATEADGYNIQENNHPAAGQIVPHVHFHIIPRFSDDGFTFDWKKKQYGDGEMQEYAEKIKSAF